MVPSARFRVRQHVGALRPLGIQLREFVAPVSTYPPARRYLRPAWGIAALAASLPRVLAGWRFDVSLLQREMISTLVTLEPFLRRPRVLDVDDAIFLHRDGAAARRLAQLCDAVICGNAYLADWFRPHARKVVVIPTAVDVATYTPAAARERNRPVLGWIGTSGNLKYLRAIDGALHQALTAVPGSRLRIVSDQAPDLRLVPPDRVDYTRWSAGGEVADIQGMDVGLMPLEDSPWARGKCSFKMLQYMACGLPVVVSPVGMNAEVLALGPCGYAAATEREWVDRLVGLLDHRADRERCGAEGRRIVESSFSIQVVAPQIARVLAGA